MRIPMTSLMPSLLALEENKNPKKKPPLMAHQKKTDLAGARLKPLSLPNNYDSRTLFHTR